ncbi:MAG TPA: hydrogenase maturation protease [Polyangiaceae bacterium]|jgi:hydrogenase maturation protease|nr:hydrogenase maturation protease [Polyangiaceae bacterium]
MAARVLIAGLGNVFKGDDGFGLAVTRRLAGRRLPDGVSIMDAGIRGFDLAMTLLGDYEAAILVDSTPRGGKPGTLYVLEPEPSEIAPDIDSVFLEAHSLEPARMLAFLQASGKRLGALRIVGCEPYNLGSDDDPQIGLSPMVEAAIVPAVSAIESMVLELSAMKRARSIRRPKRAPEREVEVDVEVEPSKSTVRNKGEPRLLMLPRKMVAGAGPHSSF